MTRQFTDWQDVIHLYALLHHVVSPPSTYPSGTLSLVIQYNDA